MDHDRLAASLVVAGFASPEVNPAIREVMKRGVSGAILFKHNVVSAPQVARLCAELKREAGRPFLLCVDQEGGRVRRLRGAPFTDVPSMRAVGALGDESLAEAVGTLLAREVRAAGFDVDFAPVLDVDTNPANPVIGERSFSRDPQQVARLGVALGRALEAAGVAACGKHFPGHGDTAQDSHLTLPRLPHAMNRLREIELVPFEAYAKASLSAIMTTHVVFEALAPGVPATFAEPVQTGLLRRELGFQGVIVSDDLEMKAIADNYSMGEAAVRAVAAGVDLLLICHRDDRQHEAIDALAREAARSDAFRRRMEASAARVEAWTSRFAAPPCAEPENALDALCSPEHRALAARVLAATPVA